MTLYLSNACFSIACGAKYYTTNLFLFLLFHNFEIESNLNLINFSKVGDICLTIIAQSMCQVVHLYKGKDQ